MKVNGMKIPIITELDRQDLCQFFVIQQKFQYFEFHGILPIFSMTTE